MAVAQNDAKHLFYLSGELNLGNYVGLDFGLNYVLNETYAFKLGFTGNIREPVSEPEDYLSGLVSVLSFGTTNPYDHFLTTRADFGRMINLNQKKTIRLNLAVGLGYTIIKEPINWQLRVFEGISFDSNYTFDYNSYGTLSLIINPKIEFPISHIFGFSISPMLQINKDRTYIGIGIGSIVGKLK